MWTRFPSKSRGLMRCVVIAAVIGSGPALFGQSSPPGSATPAWQKSQARTATSTSATATTSTDLEKIDRRLDQLSTKVDSKNLFNPHTSLSGSVQRILSMLRAELRFAHPR